LGARASHFVPELTADPVGWLGKRLSDLEGVLDEAGLVRDDPGGSDADHLRLAAPGILDAVRRVLGLVRAGELGQPPPGPRPASARVGWL